MISTAARPLWAIATALACIACADEQRAPELPPNLVVIMTDDQRWDEMPYMPIVQERLVAHGVDFENSVVTTSLCCPSRASFLSGRYAHEHGIITLGGAPKFDASSTVAVWLQRVGYRTGLIGKYLNDNARLAPRIPPGWNTWKTFADRIQSFGGGWLYYDYDLNENGRMVHYGSEPEDYSTDRLANMAVDFIREGSEPFFLVYTPFGPHAPPMPAPRHRGAFADLELGVRGNYHEADVSDKPRHVREYPGHDDWSQERADKLTAGVRSKRIPILESLLAVDEAVGAILDALTERGVDDRTVVFFTSDNGFLWGEHFKLGKLYAYEESIRVPLVVRDPRVGGPRVESALVANIDLAPTLAELGGAAIPPEIDGRSFLPVLREQSRETWREDVLIELPPDGDRYAFVGVRTRRWKYVSNLNEGPFEELYDLDADPLELDNLLVTRPESPEVRRQAAHLRQRTAVLSGRTPASLQ